MDYATKTEFHSKIALNLVYVLRKMSARRRVQFNTEYAPVCAKLKDLARTLEPYRQEIIDAQDAAKLLPCTCSGHDHIDDESRTTIAGSEEVVVTKLTSCKSCKCRQPEYRTGLLQEHSDRLDDYQSHRRDHYYPALIAWAVESVSGISIDNRAISVDGVIDLPDALVDEVGAEIDRLTGLSVEEQLGFKSPGTSNAPVAGLTTDFSAESAK